MIIKQFKTNNNIGKAIEYMMDREKHNNKCEFIYGDNIRKVALLSENRFKKQYDVFCLSLSKTDSLKFMNTDGTIDKEKLSKIIESFEHDVLTNGGTLDRTKTGASWYAHWDKGRIELNCILARCTEDNHYYNPLNIGSDTGKFKTPQYSRYTNWLLKTNVKYGMEIAEENEWKIKIKGVNTNNAGELKKNDMDKIYEHYINHLNKVQHKFNSRSEFISYLKKSGTKVMDKDKNGKEYSNGIRIILSKDLVKYYARELGINLSKLNMNRISGRFIQGGSAAKLCLNTKEKLINHFITNGKSHIARLKGYYMRDKNNEQIKNNIVSICDQTISKINDKFSKDKRYAKSINKDNVADMKEIKEFMKIGTEHAKKEIEAYTKLKQNFSDTYNLVLGLQNSISSINDFVNSLSSLNANDIISTAVNLTSGVSEFVWYIDPKTGKWMTKPNPLYYVLKEQEAEILRAKLSQSYNTHFSI